MVNKIYCNLIRSHMALNGLTPTLKEAETMEMWEYVWSKRKEIRNLNFQRSDSIKS